MTGRHMRVAVTGASGFVGGRVARALAADGFEVVAFGRRAVSALAHPLPNYHCWDITGADSPPAVGAIDAVVHCAALVGDWGPEQVYHRANVDGTRRVLDTFGAASRIVHLSTSSVYSRSPGSAAIREDAPVGDSVAAYGRTKAAAELVVANARPDAVILRPHVVYGPGDTTLLPRVIDAIRFGRLPIPGSGRNQISVTHVDNLVGAVSCALSSNATGAFNVADALPVTVDDLLRTIFRRTGVRVAIQYVPRPLAWGAAWALELCWPSHAAPRGPLITRYVVEQLADGHVLDLTRARTLLGYAPRWTHVDGPLHE